MYMAIVSISGEKEILEEEAKKEEMKNMDKESRQVAIVPPKVEVSLLSLYLHGVMGGMACDLSSLPMDKCNKSVQSCPFYSCLLQLLNRIHTSQSSQSIEIPSFDLPRLCVLKKEKEEV